MKRSVALVLLLSLLITLGACTQTPPETPEPPTKSTEPIVPPEVTLLLNLEKTDRETHISVFPANRTSGQEYAYIHLTIQGEKDREDLRVVVEKKTGKNDEVIGDFQVVSDSIKNVPGDGGYWIRFLITDPNTYFYRVTVYYGEHEILLATRTIYTPFATPKYTESDFTDAAPEFHPINGIVEGEQEMYDKLRYAITDYAQSAYYVGLNAITAWQGDTQMYLQVEFQVTDGTETVWFAIDHNNPQNYTTGETAASVVPNGQCTDEQLVQMDLFYVRQALTQDIHG